MLYEVLTGTHPFANLLPAEQLTRQLSHPLPALQERLPDLPAALNTIIQQATAKAPNERYPNVARMLLDWHRTMTNPSTTLRAGDERRTMKRRAHNRGRSCVLHSFAPLRAGSSSSV